MRYPQAGLTLTKEQNNTREPLTESQTRAYTLSLSLSHTYKESPIHKNKKVQGTWACHTNTQAHTLRYVHTLSQTHAYTHTFTTNKETPKSSAYTRTRTHTHTHTHGLTGGPMTVLQASPPNPSPKICLQLSGLCWEQQEIQSCLCLLGEMPGFQPFLHLWKTKAFWSCLLLPASKAAGARRVCMWVGGRV